MKIISLSNVKLNIRNYVLFTMYSAPLIDLLNGLIGDVVPIGKITRPCLLLLNLVFAFCHVPKSLKQKNFTIVLIVIYIIAQSLIIEALFSGNTLTHNLNFDMKVILFLSEMLLIMNCIERQTITYADIEKFWKFSCWFVPASLIGAKVLNIANALLDTKAGLYASINAMSIIFVMQFTLSIYYAEKKFIYWGAVLLNIIAAALLGTKSPYLFMTAVVIALLFFYSRHRIRLLVLMLLGGIVAYVLLGSFFADKMAPLIEYQKHNLALVMNNSNTLWGYLTSGRNIMLQNAWNSIADSSLAFGAVFFGIGHSPLSGIEMDFFEILFSFGIVITAMIYYVILGAFRWKSVDKTSCLFLNLALVCMLAAGTLGGHTLLEAIAGTYSAILLGYKYSLKRKHVYRMKMDKRSCSQGDNSEEIKYLHNNV